MNANEALDAARKVAKQAQPLLDLASALADVVSLEQMGAELTAVVKAKRGDLDALEAELAVKRSVVAQLDLAETEAQRRAAAVIEDANARAAQILAFAQEQVALVERDAHGGLAALEENVETLQKRIASLTATLEGKQAEYDAIVTKIAAVKQAALDAINAAGERA